MNRGIVVLDGDGFTGMANARAAELLGISAGAVAATLRAERMRASFAGIPVTTQGGLFR